MLCNACHDRDVWSDDDGDSNVDAHRYGVAGMLGGNDVRPEVGVISPSTSWEEKAMARALDSISLVPMRGRDFAPS